MQNDATASIESGVVVDADSLLVHANNDAHNINLALQGGTADTFAFNGAFNSLTIDNRTIAKISSDAQIKTGAGLIRMARDYDTIRGGDNSLFTSVPQFSPTETFEDSASNQRIDATNDIIYSVSNTHLTLPKKAKV